MDIKAFKDDNRAQISVEFIIGFLVFILVFTALLPTIANSTQWLITNDTNLGSAEKSLLGIVTLLLVVAVVVGIVRRTT